MRKQFLTIIATIFLSLTGMSVALAQTCTASITDMNFGTVNLQSGAAVDTTATSSVTCTSSLNLALLMRLCPNLDAGSGGSSGGNRLMLNGANNLTYQFYQDANRTIPWGSSTNATLGTVPPIDVVAPILGPGNGNPHDLWSYSGLAGIETRRDLLINICWWASARKLCSLSVGST